MFLATQRRGDRETAPPPSGSSSGRGRTSVDAGVFLPAGEGRALCRAGRWPERKKFHLTTWHANRRLLWVAQEGEPEFQNSLVLVYESTQVEFGRGKLRRVELVPPKKYPPSAARTLLWFSGVPEKPSQLE